MFKKSRKKANRNYSKEQKNRRVIIEICSFSGKAIKKYNSIREAVKATTVGCGAQIRRVLNKKSATAGGSCWKLFNDWLLEIKKDGNRSFKKLIQDFDIRKNEMIAVTEVISYHTQRLNRVWEKMEAT